MAGSINFHKKGKRNRIAPEINITPLVDVMLVLLIIFMITSPMLVSGVHVDLPQSKAKQISSNDKPLSVTIATGGKIYIMDTEVSNAELVSKLKAITNNKMDTKIYVRGDKNISYGIVMETIGKISASGFSKVALVSKFQYE
jgi:biopolymer transport protein TolR